MEVSRNKWLMSFKLDTFLSSVMKPHAIPSRAWILPLCGVCASHTPPPVRCPAATSVTTGTVEGSRCLCSCDPTLLPDDPMSFA